MVAPAQTLDAGLWATVCQGVSDCVNFLDVKVWQVVAPYLQVALNFVSEHSKEFIWGAIGIATGAALAAVCAFFCCKPTAAPGEQPPVAKTPAVAVPAP